MAYLLADLRIILENEFKYFYTARGSRFAPNDFPNIWWSHETRGPSAKIDRGYVSNLGGQSVPFFEDATN